MPRATLTPVLALVLALGAQTGAQCSTGAGGPLNLTSGTHAIDTDTGDLDGNPTPAWDGTAFNFTDITIGAGVTLNATGTQALLLLASSNATIAGTINAAGTAGGPGGSGCNDLGGGAPGVGGPGGYDGGGGGGSAPGSGTQNGDPGSGPGGGGGGVTAGDNGSGGGGGAGHLIAGTAGQVGLSDPGVTPGAAGIAYGHPPLDGGSGGGGGSVEKDGAPAGSLISGDDDGAGGGGGGGAVLIVAFGTLTVTGTINCAGGAGGLADCSAGDGGGGSGGTIELLAGSMPATGGATLNVAGGTGGGTSGGAGAAGITSTGLHTCISLGLIVGGPPAMTQLVDASATGLVPQVASMSAVGGNIDLDGCTLDASGTGDDSVDISDVQVHHDVDASGDVSPGDVLLWASGGGFPADDGQLVATFGTPLTIPDLTVETLLVVVDLAGSALGSETFQVVISDLSMPAPPGAATAGLPRPGDTLEILPTTITAVVGAFSPAQPVTGHNHETDLTMVQIDLTAAGSGGELLSLDLVASGPGDDVGGIAQVRLAVEDPASTNGVLDGADQVVFSGVYPADDGTLACTLAPPAQVLLMQTVSLLVLYDFTATAAGPAPPLQYDVSVQNLVSTGAVDTPGGDPQGSALVELGCPLVQCGDCNSDGLTTVVDALLAAQHGAVLLVLTGPDFSGCNVTGPVEPHAGAAVGVLDALILAQYAAGIAPTLNCCTP